MKKEYLEKAGAIIIREENGSKKVLLAHRSRGFNDWSFPKGHIEAGETPEVTAKREVMEETGLDIELLEELPPIVYKSNEGTVKQYTFLAHEKGGKLQNNDENDKLAWMTYENARGTLSYPNLQVLLDNAIIRKPNLAST